jgi:ribonuclease P protein component
LTPQNTSSPRAVTRLKRRSEFLKAARLGKKWVAAGLIVQARQRNQGENPCEGGNDAVRVGFTVTKKVGNAVIRNRVRRRLKAAAAEVLPKLAGPGQDLVIIGRMATIKRRFPALIRDLETSIRKLNDNGALKKSLTGTPGKKRNRDGGSRT